MHFEKLKHHQTVVSRTSGLVGPLLTANSLEVLWGEEESSALRARNPNCTKTPTKLEVCPPRRWQNLSTLLAQCGRHEKGCSHLLLVAKRFHRGNPRTKVGDLCEKCAQVICAGQSLQTAFRLSFTAVAQSSPKAPLVAKTRFETIPSDVSRTHRHVAAKNSRGCSCHMAAKLFVLLVCCACALLTVHSVYRNPQECLQHCGVSLKMPLASKCMPCSACAVEHCERALLTETAHAEYARIGVVCQFPQVRFWQQVWSSHFHFRSVHSDATL